MHKPDLCLITSCVLAVAVAATTTSCSIIGGGVAGAGWDPVWSRYAAKNYKRFQDASVHISKEDVYLPDLRQGFLHMLDDFPEHTLVDQNSDGYLGDLHISFRRFPRIRLRVARKGGTIIDEKLPSVFYMHNLQAARFRAGSEELLLFLTKSRATTGLYWIGLYRSDGTRLLTTTMGAGCVWECNASPTGPYFICPTQKTTFLVNNYMPHAPKTTMEEALAKAEKYIADNHIDISAMVLMAVWHRTYPDAKNNGWTAIWRPKDRHILDGELRVYVFDDGRINHGGSA